jgi:hypothetical protein
VPLREALTAFAFIDKVFGLFGVIQFVKHFDVFISIHVCVTLFKLKTTGTITRGSIKQKPQGETRLRLNIQSNDLNRYNNSPSRGALRTSFTDIEMAFIKCASFQKKI